jgi:hypothetical protein
MVKVNWHKQTGTPATGPVVYPTWYAEVALYDAETERLRLVRVAQASMTGRPGIDIYPWDWWLTDEGVDRAYSLLPRESTKTLRTAGAADTLRSVKWSVADLMTVER